MTERYGIYFAPACQTALWKLGSDWLGRDCMSGGSIIQPALNAPELSLADFTKSPRRYGFHATLKPPFALAKGLTVHGLHDALKNFSLATKPVPIGELKLRRIGSFLALKPKQQSPALTEFAASCVKNFEPFRAPLSAESRKKRLQAGLSDRQKELLDRWGYPYVMEEFRMHLTLSDSLNDQIAPDILYAAQHWFEPILHQEHMLDRICLYKEPSTGAPFERVADFVLEG